MVICIIFEWSEETAFGGPHTIQNYLSYIRENLVGHKTIRHIFIDNTKKNMSFIVTVDKNDISFLQNHCKRIDGNFNTYHKMLVNSNEILSFYIENIKQELIGGI